MDFLLVDFKGHQLSFQVDFEFTTTSQFAELVSRNTHTDVETLKLLRAGGRLIKHRDAADVTLSTAGLLPGEKLLLLGSSQASINAVRASRDLPGLAGFQHEDRVLASRQRQRGAEVRSIPSGPYTFRQFKAWQQEGLIPHPREALKLLHRLAGDPGVIGVMRKHGWSVGTLSEMPPEGKVGVSAVCILGVNLNAGQEISLRLRTDDLKGFRRYLSIRKTLCHELAHMVHGEHDLMFKQLNSRLCRECEGLSSTSPGHLLSEAAEGWEWQPEDPGPSDVMAATAASSGQTLRKLAGHQPLPKAFGAKLLDIEGLGHRDPSTDAKERAAAKLEETGGNADPADAVNLEVAGNTAGMPGMQRGEKRLQSQHAEVPDRPDETDSGLSSIRHDSTLQAEQSLQASEHAHQFGMGEVPLAPADAAGAEGPSAAASLQEAEQAVHRLVSELQQQQAMTALQTLVTILENVLLQPENNKYRRVRQHNRAFLERAAHHRGSLDLLRAAGFEPEKEGVEEVLRLRNSDPRLLQLCKAACMSALQLLQEENLLSS